MGNGKNINPEHAKTIFDLYKVDPVAAKTLCKQYGYKKSSFYKIISLEGKINSSSTYVKPRKWTNQMIDALVRYAEENPQATLEQMHDYFIGEQHFPEVNIYTLWKYLDGELITLKKATTHNQRRNEPDIKIERMDFASWFLQNQNLNFIYIDECGFNINTIRSQARSHKGKRAVVPVAQNKGANKSVIMAINKDLGVISYDTKDGSMNAEDFTVFLRLLIEVLKPLNLENVTLVFDNCSIHVEEEINSVCLFAGWKYCYLPPYSPMLNPIEEAFSVLKNAIKRQLATDLYANRLAIARMPFGLKLHARIQILNQALQNAIAEVTQQKIMGFWQHMMSFMPDILALKDV